MDAGLQRLAKRLASEGEKTIAFFSDLPQEAWKQQVYTTGSCWNVRQVLAHFVATERALNELVIDIAGGGSGVPPGFEIDAFNEQEVEALEDMQIPVLLNDFQRARSEIIDWMHDLVPEDLDRTGWHPWFGETELRQMIKLIYRHNMIHLRDIRKALTEHAPVPHRHVESPIE
ncbi:MAG: DinB family protein [Anaerolineales bacterium]|jgi:hypothetical protein